MGLTLQLAKGTTEIERGGGAAWLRRRGTWERGQAEVEGGQSGVKRWFKLPCQRQAGLLHQGSSKCMRQARSRGGKQIRGGGGVAG